VALVALAALAWMLAGWCTTSWFEARRSLADRQATLAAFGTPTQPRLKGSGAGGAIEDEHTLGATIAELVPEHDAASRAGDTSYLLEQVEALAAEAGVTLLQFIPQATATAKDPAAVVRLQLQGPANAREALLLTLGDPAPAVEMGSLRLASGPQAGVLLCDLVVRLRDAAFLARLALAHPGQVGPGAAGRIPVRAAPSDNSALTPHLIPAMAFATPRPSQPAGPLPLAVGIVPDTPKAATSGAGTSGSANPGAARPAVMGAPGSSAHDPLAGVRLRGVLEAGEQVAVLLDLPGTGALLLRRSERLGLTRFRLESAAAGRASLIGDAGERRVLGLEEDAREENVREKNVGVPR